MSGYEDHLVADARLVILKELVSQMSGTLNETLIAAALDRFGHRRSREWVRTQISKLGELGALKVTSEGSVLVATVTRSGTDHVERRSFIEGVARPAPEI